MVDMTQEREERARETIEALNTEIQNLTKVIEEKTLGAEDTNLNELRKLRDELTNQRDNLKGEVAALKVRFDLHNSKRFLISLIRKSISVFLLILFVYRRIKRLLQNRLRSYRLIKQNLMRPFQPFKPICSQGPMR